MSGYPTPSGLADKVNVDPAPVPERDVALVPAPPLAVTLSVATFEPVLVGLNVTSIAQLAPGASEVPQLLVCANWKGLVPPMAIDVIGKVCAADVE